LQSQCLPTQTPQPFD